MLSEAQKVAAQGVGSVYLETVPMIKEKDSDLFEVYENSSSSNFDIYHIHTVNPKFFNRINSHHVNVMFVHFVPETLEGTLNIPGFAKKVFYKYLINFLKKCDELVVVNPMYAKGLVEMGVKESSITYIPNFVSDEMFHEISEEEKLKIRDEYKIPHDKFVVTSCGQLHQQKGVLDFAEVARKCPEFIFVWVGGFVFGKSSGGYKEIKELYDNPPENLIFTGIIDREKINKVFNAADVYFMPSYQEFFPMSILEACSSKKPLVLRDIECYEHIFKDQYLKGKDNDEFAERLRRLQKDKELFEKYKKLSYKIAVDNSKENVNKMWREYYVRIYNKYLNDPNKKLKSLDVELKPIKEKNLK